MAVAAVVGGILAVGGGIAYEDISSDARDRANQARKEAYDQNQALLTEQRNMKEKEQRVSNETRMAEQALARQRALAAKAQGRSGTILTTPLGVAQPGATTGAKTILGS